MLITPKVSGLKSQVSVSDVQCQVSVNRQGAKKRQVRQDKNS